MDFPLESPQVPAGPRIPWESAAAALQSSGRGDRDSSGSSSSSHLGSAAPETATETTRDAPRMVIGVCAMRVKTDSKGDTWFV